MTSDISPLVEEWRGRLAGAGWLDLRRETELFPELIDAIAPATYAVVVRSGEVITDSDSYLEAGIDAYLVPEGVPAPEPDDEFERNAAYGRIEMGLDTENRELRISQLDLPSDQQTYGLGTLLIAQLVELADDPRLEAVVLEASDVGRWAWMRCGFDFANPHSREQTLAAAGFARRLGRDVALGSIEHTWELVDLNGTITADEIQAAGGPMISAVGTPIALGKALVLGPPPAANPWWGRLDLRTGARGRVRLHEYLASRDLAYRSENAPEA